MAAQLSTSCLLNPNHQLPPAYTHTTLINPNTAAPDHSINQSHLYHHLHNHLDQYTTNNCNNINSDNNINSTSCSLDSHSLHHDDQSLLQQLDQDSHSQQFPDSLTIINNIKGARLNMSMMGADEYESKSSSDNPDECEHELLPPDGRPNKKRYHRHSQHQIQEMERVFKECPHPDEKQRLELSRDLKLDPRQVKFWFQNKRTQVKAQHERHDNAYLRTENEKLRAENLALRDAIANVTCPNCGGPATLADVSFDEQQLRVENVRLREEIDRISKIAAKHVGRPISTLNLGSTLPSPISTTNSTLYISNEIQGGNNNSNLLENEASNQPSLLLSQKPIRLLDSEKPLVVELAIAASEELIQVVEASEPLWLLDPLSGIEIMDHQHYLQAFPHNDLNMQSSNLRNLRRESTRDTGLVMMDATSLVDMFMNVAEWAELFSSIVSRALPIEVLSNGIKSNHDGALQIIYAELQLPTPMVPTRESYFLRYAKQVTCHNTSAMWVVVDASIDSLPRTTSTSTSLIRCRRRPSGCIIEEMSNGCSKVTWVEHFEVDEYKGVHHLYEQLVSSGMAFGAQRWLATLQRQCESMHAANNTITSGPTKDLAITPTIEGRRSILKLAERMTNSFCGGVSASVVHTWITLSAGCSTTPTCDEMVGVPASQEDVRVLIRKSVDDPGRPPGVVLCAATSIWLPTLPSRVFHFLRDQSFRTEWDILSNMGPVEEIMHVPKGHHDNGNSVSLLRVNALSSNQPNMLILQECCAEETSYVVVYAPVDIGAMSSVINGGDPDCVALLPSGFSIFPDRPHRHPLVPSSDLGHPTTIPSGSLLTVAFQILVDHVPTAKLSLGSVATVNNLISSTVLRIKNALSCQNACIS